LPITVPSATPVGPRCGASNRELPTLRTAAVTKGATARHALVSARVTAAAGISVTTVRTAAAPRTKSATAQAGWLATSPVHATSSGCPVSARAVMPAPASEPRIAVPVCTAAARSSVRPSLEASAALTCFATESDWSTAREATA
jgi:hypothetical protein